MKSYAKPMGKTPMPFMMAMTMKKPAAKKPAAKKAAKKMMPKKKM